MKKAISLILASLMTATAGAPSLSQAHQSNYRVTTGTTTDTVADCTRIVTDDGQWWLIYDELPLRSRVTVVFDTMSTADITDDEIVAIDVIDCTAE